MNIKHNTRVATIATVAAVAVAGLGTGISTPAMAYTPATSSAMTLSNGPVKPTVKKMTWKECWGGFYAQYRTRGFSIATASDAADLWCGKTPEEGGF